MNKKRNKIILFGLLGLPVLCVLYVAGAYAISNYPFNSNLLAHVASPDGKNEVCVVQTFKVGFEPYQVSYYTRQTGGPWVWHYLAHQDDRWRNCRVVFAGDTLQIYRGSKLHRTNLLKVATSPPKGAREQLPGDYAPAQILAHHRKYYRS